MRVRPLARSATLVGLLTACAEPSPSADTHETEAETETGADLPEACQPAGEPPETIEALVARIDALPRPVTIPCVLASLPRPLRLVATTSVFSVQPGTEEDPRVFVLGASLILSIVSAGEGRELLEFSEAVSATHTVKGELAFPIEGELEPATAYDLEFEPGMTRCAICHGDEQALPEHPGGFASEALRPTDTSLVPISSLLTSLEGCAWASEPERCAMLSALLDHGPVEQGSFDPALPTVFD